jgi:hypothetical protein
LIEVQVYWSKLAGQGFPAKGQILEAMKNLGFKAE